MRALTLLLHIGYHKTGTTWLQTHLFRNPATGFLLPFDYTKIDKWLVRPHALEYDAEKCYQHFSACFQDAQGLYPVLSHESSYAIGKEQPKERCLPRAKLYYV